MRFKYIGSKQDGERAFHELTGIVWMPGDEREVTSLPAAAEMAKHGSVWQCLGDAATLPAIVRPRPSNIGNLNDEDVFDAAEEREELIRKAIPAETFALLESTRAEIAKVAGIKSAPLGGPLTGKDDAAVRSFAKEQGLKVHGIGVMKGETLRARVLAAMSA